LNTLTRMTAALVSAGVALGLAVAAAAPASAAAADGYYKQPFDPAVWRVDGGNAHAISYDEWAAAGFPEPAPSPTDYVKYAWSPTVYAVTFWGPQESTWDWDRLTEPQWRSSGSPVPRTAGWIIGSTYYQWGTASELFVQGEDGVRHKLTYNEWAASGFRAYEWRSNEGFQKLAWAPEILRMTNLSGGNGYAINYAQWTAESFPTPQVVPGLPGHEFYHYGNGATIYYGGPAFTRPINYTEWMNAGRPTPVRRRPAYPGDVDCTTHFQTQAQAQDWYNTYYPDYGDVAQLDGDNDGKACEMLP
jgi:hypothetical protein